MRKSIVQTSGNVLIGGLLVIEYYGFVDFCAYYLTVMRTMEAIR